MKRRTFKILDIDCNVEVEITTRKDVLGYIDELVENVEYGYDMSDYSCEILYNDGTSDSINYEYDGHKIRKQNIASIAFDNPCTTIVYGNFEINEYGVVHAAYNEKIAESNIVEITK